MLVGLLGSGEFEPWSAGVDRFLLERAKGNGSVAYLPAASAPEGDEVFNNWAQMGRDHYNSIDVPSVLVPIKNEQDANNPDYAAMIADVSMIFFSGGNPAYLAQILMKSLFWEAVLARHHDGAAVAGCSAGAVFLGEIAPDASVEVPDESALSQPGMKLLPGLVIGPHWDALDTFFPGLQQMFIDFIPEGCVGLGVDENTAAVTDGSAWTVFGSLGAHVYRDRTPAGTYTGGQTFTL